MTTKRHVPKVYNVMEWAQRAPAGDYLAAYPAGSVLDAETKPYALCGYDDATIAEIERVLRGRGMQLFADGVGLLCDVQEPTP